jgi:hypothetical protein
MNSRFLLNHRRIPECFINIEYNRDEKILIVSGDRGYGSIVQNVLDCYIPQANRKRRKKRDFYLVNNRISFEYYCVEEHFVVDMIKDIDIIYKVKIC